MEMPFGKHKGEEIADIPHSYLKWLAENAKLRGNLKKAVDDALATAGPDFNPKPKKPYEIKIIYRDLAKRWHPDHGGSVDGMAAINEFMERLSE